jgi:outer membrane protein TolC
MVKISLYTLLMLLCCSVVKGQKKSLDFFITEGLKNNPSVIEINNLKQYFKIQDDFINAQNKAPQVFLSADYLFAPFFFDNGRPLNITTSPSAKAFGYDAALTNGGLYAAQLNIGINLFNTALVNRLLSQNKAQADISAFGRRQIEHDTKKTIIDQYIITYQFYQQVDYLKKIIEQLESRKPLVAALVKNGLLQQNDFLLLDIQLSTNNNELKQLQFAYNNGVAILKNLALVNDTAGFSLEKPLIEINEEIVEFNYQQKFKLDSLNIQAQQNVFETRYLPQLSLLGSTGVYASDIRNLPHNVGLSAGLHLNLPISDGHQRKLNQQQNKILMTNQQAYLSTAALLQSNNLRNAKKQIEQWRQTIGMAIEPIQKQELLLDIIKDKVVKGQVTVMDYINSLQDYAVLQKNKALAETNLLLYINQYNYYNW